MDATAMLRIVRALGHDRFVSRGDVPAALPEAFVDRAWRVYQDFDTFTGGSIDPLFSRLDHPARFTGSAAFTRHDTVAIVGTGPSFAPAIPELCRLRPHLRIITSPRGAEALRPHGIVPDIVLIVHRTALDAELTVRQVRYRDGRPAFADVPWVAAEAKTPAALVRDVAPERLFIPDNLLGWGVWPADAVAMALDGGAQRIALIGIDLGTPAARHPASTPVAALLSLLVPDNPGSFSSGTTFADCGVLAAPKPGWPRAPLANFASRSSPDPLVVVRRAHPPLATRLDRERAALRALDPMLLDVDEALHDALALRAPRRRAAHLVRAASLSSRESGLARAADRILAMKDDLVVRRLVLETLGASFLPRLWRSGIHRAATQSLWRPMVLATHELVAQADRLRSRISAVDSRRSCDTAA